MTKREARALARARRAALPAGELAALGAAMARQLFALEVWRAAQSVFCFVSLPDEPDTEPILRGELAAGKRLFVPRAAAGVMETVPVADLAALRPGAYGIREPAGPAAPLPAGALVLVPCLAADESGVRLGRGGGYYDRFLAVHSGPRLLLCPAALVFPALPHDGWDVPFAPNTILTEHGLLQSRKENRT